MSFRHSIDPSLRDSWLPLIEYHYDLTLSPLRRLLRSTHVRFEEVLDNQRTCYRFEVSAKSVAGEPLFFSGQHTDGKVVIADVFSRARRDVSRRRRAVGLSRVH